MTSSGHVLWTLINREARGSKLIITVYMRILRQTIEWVHVEFGSTGRQSNMAVVVRKCSVPSVMYFYQKMIVRGKQKKFLLHAVDRSG